MFGVVPALRAALRSTFEALKEGGRADATPAAGVIGCSGSLVVAQFALALMLSVGAGLLRAQFRPAARARIPVSAPSTW